MNLPFSEKPGSQERHLLRRHDNPLFGDRHSVSEENLLNAQDKDRQEREAFYQQFQTVLQEITEFSGQEESEKILAMKQRVDQMYEQCCGLAGENQKAIDGLARLQDMIMQAITHGAADDANAMKEIEQEQLARTVHQQLLTFPIICDLLRPESAISKEDLAASILSADIDSIQAAMNLFQAEHLQALIASCEKLIASCEEQGEDMNDPKNKLQNLHDALETR